MKKKLLLAVIGAMSVFTLAACSGNSNTEIATMKGAKLTVADFYEKAKTDQNSQEIVFDMILSEIFVGKYGDQVTDEAVEEEINTIFGDTFEEQLAASNLTRKDVESSIRERLAFEEGLKSHVELTDDDLKTAWEAFHPEVEAQLISVATEEEAAEVVDEANEDGADFGAIAEEKSIDPSSQEQGNVTFDSANTEIPEEVKAAAWDLADGEISDPIAVDSVYGTSYYVVKMVKNQDKGNDMSQFEDQIKEIATDTKLNDTEFTTKVIGEELTEANVKIKDDAFADILSGFITNDDAATENSEPVDTTEDSE
ncbi:peptidylprolyl isomerase [Enterococcus olivae]